MLNTILLPSVFTILLIEPPVLQGPLSPIS